MEIPELIDIVYDQILDKYREQIIKEDRCILMTDTDEEKNVLTKQLTEEQNKLLNRFTYALENKYDYINYKINAYVLYVGIKYGIELQKALSNE